MPDVLDHASQWLDEQRTAHMAQTVAYARGANSINVPATMGKTMFEQVDGAGGILHQLEYRDFIINAADLILGALTEPKVGDRITVLNEVYEVMSPGGEQAWRFTDPYRRTYRIHTKHVGVAP